MAKSKTPKVELGNLPANQQLDSTPAETKKTGKSNKPNDKNNKKGRASSKKQTGASIKKFFRDLLSELKKVSWGKMKTTKNNKGVLSQTGVVLLFVLVAIIILTCMDLGLTALLNLLIGVAA